jgi:hypothetical protein
VVTLIQRLAPEASPCARSALAFTRQLTIGDGGLIDRRRRSADFLAV